MNLHNQGKHSFQKGFCEDLEEGKENHWNKWMLEKIYASC